VSALAQVYPVQVTTIMRPPYSLSLTDYASPTYDRIQANIYMADLTKVHYAAKVRLVIRGAGGIVISTLPGQEIGPIFLNGGQTVIMTGAELNQLFSTDKLQFSGISLQQYRQNNKLPEGIYQFHFEVSDYNLGVTVSNVNNGFASAWLILNDPPLINKPENNSTVVPTNPQNILFQWTPRHTGSPNSAFNTVYDIEIVEINPPDRNPNDAILTSPSIFQTTVTTTSYNYTIMDPNLFPERWYAFRIRARDQDGKDLFKNQGYSEVYRFYYGQMCPVPEEVEVEMIDMTSAMSYWDKNDLFQSADVQYKSTDEKNWSSLNTTQNNVVLPALIPGKEYRIKVAGRCPNNSSAYSDEVVYINNGNQNPSGGGDTTGGNGGRPTCDVPLQEQIKTVVTDTQSVLISWTTETWFDSYSFRYRLLGTEFFTEVKSVQSNVLLSDLENDQVYEYQILYHCTTDEWQEGEYNTFKISFPVVVESTGDCFPPSDIRSQVNSDLSATIAWTKDKDTKGSRIYWRLKDVPGIDWDSTDASGSDTKLKNISANVEYEYKISSICKVGGISIPSLIQTFNTSTTYSNNGDCVPPTLKKPTVTSNTEARLEWEPKSLYTGYQIQYHSKGDKEWLNIQTNRPSELVSYLNPSTTYEYKVIGYCGVSASDPSVVDSFKTNAVPPADFACGASTMVQIKSKNPIASLKVGDKFSAADFDLTIKTMVSERPYNGIATAVVPYLKNSTFDFGYENIWVNEYGQMYQGKVYLKGVTLRVINENLANQINNFVNKLDEGLSKASNYLTLADSIQDALNDIIQTQNQPVDWKKYEGWTADQLLAEGKRLVSEGQKLFGNGAPNSIAQAKQMVMEGIQLIKMAAALGNQGLKVASKKVKDWLAKILKKMDQEVGPKIDSTQQKIEQMNPTLDQDYAKTQNPALDQYEVYPSDVAVGDMKKDPVATGSDHAKEVSQDSKLSTLYKDNKSYRGNEYNLEKYKKIQGYIKFFSQDANAQALTNQMQSDLKDTFKGRNIDDIPDEEMDQLVVKIEAYIQAYIDNKAKDDLNSGK